MFDNKFKFSLGEISPPLVYRVDTEIPSKGLRYLKNGMSTSSAGLTNFPKLKKRKTIEIRKAKALKVFKYKINKKNTSLNGYLFVFTNYELSILRQDTLEKIKDISLNYTAEQIKNLSIAQFENSIIICVEGKKPEMIRVDEEREEFTVVTYWENIKNPPVKKVESVYKYTEDTLVFTWYKENSKVIFENTLDKAIYDREFIRKINKGTLAIFGGEFRIERIDNWDGKHKFTTIEITKPDGLEIPKKEEELEKRKINVLDISFSENIFNKGYPAVVGEHNGRVVFGNVAGNPSIVVASRVFDSLNFRQSLEDNDGFTTFITGNEVNTIKEFISYKSLIAITDKGVFSTELNGEFTTKNSAFYDQKMPRPKGLGYWCEGDDAIYYVDSTDKIYQIQDTGQEGGYRAVDITTYSSHLFKDIQDIYFFKIGKNNIIGVDQKGNEGRALSYNLQENILCWSRINKLDGENEYVNIDDKLYIFTTVDDGGLVYSYSETEVEPLILELPETTLISKINIDVPEFFKRKKIGRVKILCFGAYEFKVNDLIVRDDIHSLVNPPNNYIYNDLHTITIQNVGNNTLKIEQLNNNKLEIVGISTDILNLKGEDE